MAKGIGYFWLSHSHLIFILLVSVTKLCCRLNACNLRFQTNVIFVSKIKAKEAYGSPTRQEKSRNKIIFIFEEHKYLTNIRGVAEAYCHASLHPKTEPCGGMLRDRFIMECGMGLIMSIIYNLLSSTIILLFFLMIFMPYGSASLKKYTKNSGKRSKHYTPEKVKEFSSFHPPTRN